MKKISQDITKRIKGQIRIRIHLQQRYECDQATENGPIPLHPKREKELLTSLYKSKIGQLQMVAQTCLTKLKRGVKKPQLMVNCSYPSHANKPFMWIWNNTFSLHNHSTSTKFHKDFLSIKVANNSNIRCQSIKFKDPRRKEKSETIANEKRRDCNKI